MDRPRVNYLLLYRGNRDWHITVGTPDELACGAVTRTAVSEPFDLAAQEFAALLQTEWGVEDPIAWRGIQPDWWGAEVVPGALEAAGETPE